MRHYPELSRWAHCNQKGPFKRGIRRSVGREDDVVTEAETGVVICDDRGTTSQGMQAPLEDEKDKERDSPPEPPKGMLPN